MRKTNVLLLTLAKKRFTIRGVLIDQKVLGSNKIVIFTEVCVHLASFCVLT